MDPECELPEPHPSVKVRRTAVSGVLCMNSIARPCGARLLECQASVGSICIRTLHFFFTFCYDFFGKTLFGLVVWVGGWQGVGRSVGPRVGFARYFCFFHLLECFRFSGVQAGLGPEPQLLDSAASTFEVRCEVPASVSYSFAVFVALTGTFVFPETNRFWFSSQLPALYSAVYPLGPRTTGVKLTTGLLKSVFEPLQIFYFCTSLTIQKRLRTC